MRLFGHAAHPALVHFPIAAWIFTPASDAALHLTGDPFWARAGLWLNGVGLLAGAIAALAGMSELSALRQKPNAFNTVAIHIVLMIAAFALAGVSQLIRIPHGADATEINLTASALSLAAVGALLIGAWFGAQLVHKYGFGGVAGKAGAEDAC